MSTFIHDTPLGNALSFILNLTDFPRSASHSTTSVDAVDAKVYSNVQVLPVDESSYTDPKTWPLLKKMRVVAIVSWYTFAVYTGSAIYITAFPSTMKEFSLTEQSSLLGLSLYVLGYGTGPLLWAPLSEVIWIGRNPIYSTTALIFLVVSIITATAQSWPFFLALRFLQGFFGSPCLANGGASLHDIFESRYLPISMSVWVAFAYAGPAIGPVLASYLVESRGWRISMWEIAIGAAISLVLLLLLPETYAPKIVYRAQNNSKKDARQNGVNRDIVLTALKDAFWKPCLICFQDPAVAYVNIYTAYLYSCYYTFFDGFPLVYIFRYRWKLSHIGLAFLPIIVGCGVACLLYILYIMCGKSKSEGRHHETYLKPALLAVWAPPIGILIFGWTAQYNTHWAFGMIGVVIYSAGVFVVLQCLIMYILDSYPKYAASLFAANDFVRSALAAGAVHFGLPLYLNLGPGKACTVLGSVSVLGIAGMFLLYWKGAELRGRSRFTG